MAISRSVPSPCSSRLFDWRWFHGQLNCIIDGNPTYVEIRRDTKGGEVTLPTQRVRIARAGASRGIVERGGPRSKDVHSKAVIMGSPDLDIQPDDRFNYEGSLYRVISVKPHGAMGTVESPINVRAEAEKIS